MSPKAFEAPVPRATAVRRSGGSGQCSDTQEFVEWDVPNWSRALEFWRNHSVQDFSACTALELGARHGGLSLWLALLGARVVHSDLTLPTSRALAAHRASDAAGRIAYQLIDATHIPYRAAFDLVVFKSVLGAVGGQHGPEGQARALREIHQALKAGGELLFAENLVASPVHSFLRKRFVHWGERWRYTSVREMLAFLEPFTEVRYCTLGFAGALGRTAIQRSVFGAMDRLVLDRLVPQRWRYIMVGVARK
ncbi:MAG TPA: class I SAM-dependent methyltransferase [Gemmatimonadales bacterium]|nr:class I SAM-dependent methyltransferase [Gemmatimonadales bacterium]